jgi:hypothetical protein
LRDFKNIAGDALTPDLDRQVTAISKSFHFSHPFDNNILWNLRFTLFNFLRTGGLMVSDLSLPVEFRSMWFNNDSTWKKLLRISNLNLRVHQERYNAMIRTIINERSHSLPA